MYIFVTNFKFCEVNVQKQNERKYVNACFKDMNSLNTRIPKINKRNNSK